MIQNKKFEKYLKEYRKLVDECDEKDINWNEIFYMFCICKGCITSKKESHDLIEWVDDNNIEIYD